MNNTRARFLHATWPREELQAGSAGRGGDLELEGPHPPLDFRSFLLSPTLPLSLRLERLLRGFWSRFGQIDVWREARSWTVCDGNEVVKEEMRGDSGTKAGPSVSCQNKLRETSRDTRIDSERDETAYLVCQFAFGHFVQFSVLTRAGFAGVILPCASSDSVSPPSCLGICMRAVDCSRDMPLSHESWAPLSLRIRSGGRKKKPFRVLNHAMLAVTSVCSARAKCAVCGVCGVLF